MVCVQLLGLFMVFPLCRCCKMLAGGTSGYGGAPVDRKSMRVARGRWVLQNTNYKSDDKIFCVYARSLLELFFILWILKYPWNWYSVEEKRKKEKKIKRSRRISCQPSANLRDSTETPSHRICLPSLKHTCMQVPTQSHHLIKQDTKGPATKETKSFIQFLFFIFLKRTHLNIRGLQEEPSKEGKGKEQRVSDKISQVRVPFESISIQAHQSAIPLRTGFMSTFFSIFHINRC